MQKKLDPSQLLKEARLRASLTQRELAKRSGRAQSVIARIENGNTNPTTGTLNHLLEAAGFELQSELAIKPVANSHMLNDISRILAMTPEQRLREVANINRFEKAAKGV